MQKTRPSGLSWVICFRLCVKPMKAVFRLGKRGKRSPRPQRVEVLPRLYAGPRRLCCSKAGWTSRQQSSLGRKPVADHRLAEYLLPDRRREKVLRLLSAFDSRKPGPEERDIFQPKIGRSSERERVVPIV